MSLASGSRLGPYEILGLLGSGGMGEVYKARDTRLDRDVAIKILPAEVGADPDRRARFEREARAISQLTHPHICTLHDIGEAVPADRDGLAPGAQPQAPGSPPHAPWPKPLAPVHYLVMELLEGETLAARLERGPLPLAQALELGAQVADALDAAHKHGIVHRDLKPANVMLAKAGGTRSGLGTAKLLDFGLAKLRPAGPLAAGATEASTRLGSATAEGTLLGTLPYMAPEQVEGREADARTDIWALGCVLYEMAAGRRAFGATSQASLIGEIMAAEPPPLAASQPLTPPAFDHVVRTCLAKDPDERWQSAADVRRELQWMVEGMRPGAGSRPQPPLGLGRRERLAWGLTTLALLALATFALFRGTARPSSDAPAARLSIVLPSGVSVADSSYNLLAVSPDGRSVVFAGDRGGTRQLYVRHLDRLEADPLAGTEGGATMPFFSRDGKTVGFWLPTHVLMQVPAAGGTPTPLLPEHRGGGAVWDDDGTLIMGTPEGLRRLRPGAMTPEVLTTLSGEHEFGHIEPQLLPGGAILFVVKDRSRREDHNRVFVLRPGNRTPVSVIDGVSSPRFIPDGHLLFARGRRLQAARFDAERFKTADETTLTDDLQPTDAGWYYNPAAFDVAPRGTLAYLPAPQTLRSRMVLVDRSGRQEVVPTRLEHCTGVAAAPDGRRLAVQVTEAAGTEIHAMEIGRAGSTRISYGADHGLPAWMPDGRRVAFASNRDGAWDVYTAPADGSRAPERLAVGTSTSVQSIAPSFRPGGTEVLFVGSDSAVGGGLWSQKARTEQAVHILSARTLGQTGNVIVDGVFSPNGKFLAYRSRETGGYQAYVRDWPGLTSMWMVSTEGATQPRWSYDGSELLFRAGTSIMSARMTTVPQVRFEPPTRVVDLPGLIAFDVLPDGRFIVLQRVGDAPAQQIVVVPDWRSLRPSAPK